MSCDRCRLLASRSLDDDLTPAERAALDQHLEACAACRAALADFRAVQRLVRGLTATVPAPRVDRAVRSLVAGRLEPARRAGGPGHPRTSTRRPGDPPPARALAAAAALLVLLLAGPFLLLGPERALAPLAGPPLGGPVLFVGDTAGPGLLALDPASLAVRRRAPLGLTPLALAARGELVYLAGRSPDGLSLVALDRRTLRARGTVTLDGSFAPALALSPDGQRLYLADSMASTVVVLDAATLARLRPSDWSDRVGLNPTAIAVSRERGWIYVASAVEGTVVKLDPVTRSWVATFPLVEPGETPDPRERHPLIVAPADDWVYAPALAHGRVYAVHTSTHERRRYDLPLRGYAQAAVSAPDGRTLYVGWTADPSGTQPGGVVALATDSFQPVRQYTGTAPAGLALDPSSQTLFIADRASGDLRAVEVATGRLLGGTRVGAPGAVWYGP